MSDTGEMHGRFYQVATIIMDSLVSKWEEGGSVNLRGEVPTEGYMVGGKSWTLVARPELFDSYTVMDYLEAHETLLSWNTGTVYVGWWIHDGKIYLDIADNITGTGSYFQAMELGTLRKEIAIWNVKGKHEHEVKV